MEHYIVENVAPGTWVGKRMSDKKEVYRGSTQDDAFRGTKEWASRHGGGEVQVRRLDGTLGKKDTVYPGNDPRNIKG